MDLLSGNFQVLPRRVDALKQLLNDTIVKKKFVFSAKHFSCIAGSLASIGLALVLVSIGLMVARLWTRAL